MLRPSTHSIFHAPRLQRRASSYRWCALIALYFCALAQAGEPVWSGFGSLGFARSDSPLRYERFIDRAGSVKRDSQFGLQTDLEIGADWSATAQATLAQGIRDDRGWQPSLSWALLSWRPKNDFLMRVGKMRLPLYLNSENLHVGASYEFARLPTEMVSIAPTNDFSGLSLNQNWTLDQTDLSLDAYLGAADSSVRTFIGAQAPSVQADGPFFTAIKSRVGGFVLTARNQTHLLRAGLHQTSTRPADRSGWAITYPLVTLAPGIQYYQIDDHLPGPGLPSKENFNMRILTLGADLALGQDFRFVSEYSRRTVDQIISGYAGQGAYFSLLKKQGAWHHYLSYAALISAAPARQLYRDLLAVRLPASLPGAADLMASQKIGASFLLVNDQRAWTVGTAYTLTPGSNLKAEWRYLRIGEASSMLDTPFEANSKNQVLNVLSLSYNFTF